MKKIYTITLDDEIPLSDIVISDIKEIAYCLFEEIDKFDRQILVLNDKKSNLIKNELLESFNGQRYTYRFESENSNIDNYHYEPFLIGNRSFGFTVYDGEITDDEILSLINHVLTFLRLKYKFNIDSIYYDDELVDGRLSAYSYLTSGRVNNSISSNKVKKKARILASPLFSIFNL